MYAQMLVGMVALTGQWWLDSRSFKKADVCAHLVNLAWNGLTRLESKPILAPAPAPSGISERTQKVVPEGRTQKVVP